MNITSAAFILMLILTFTNALFKSKAVLLTLVNALWTTNEQLYVP